MARASSKGSDLYSKADDLAGETSRIRSAV